MTLTPDIPYGPLPRQTGDLFLPDAPTIRPPVLVIHGGGWTSLSKESLAAVARELAEAGHAAFNINYRLLGQAPWPACGDDCLLAGRAMLEGLIPGLPSARQIVVCGASAGGHLAMMTGLRLPDGQVHSIISMAGPSRIVPGQERSTSAITRPQFLEHFFGRSVSADEDCVVHASPSLIVPQSPPRLICIHSTNDQLVPLAHSEEAVAAWRARGGQATMLTFSGPGDSHGFWTTNDLSTRKLIPEVKAALKKAME